MIVIFEGIDKQGKSSLISALHKRTNYEHIVIDRFVAGFRAYNNLYDRHKDSEIQFKNIEKQFKNVQHLVVLLKTDPEIIKTRFIETNEPELPKGTIESNLELMYNEYEKLDMNKMLLDTQQEIDVCIDLILKKIKETNEKIL